MLRWTLDAGRWTLDAGSWTLYDVRFGGKRQNVKCQTIIIITIIIIMKLLCIVGFACLLFNFHDLFIIRDPS